MAPITASIDIARAPEDVFAYIDDLARHGEWQEALEQVTVETEGPVRVGTRVSERRRVPGGARAFRYEVTEHDPPRLFGFRVVSGPVRPAGRAVVSPAGEGGSRVTLELDFAGHGLLGKLLAPLARSNARKTVPRDQQRLKQRLESGASASRD